jgi:hypothetical protein
MRHDQVRAYVWSGGKGFAGCVRMPDRILKRTATVVGLFRGASADAILDTLHAAVDTGGPLRQKGASCPSRLYQELRYVAELGREILVNE